MGDPFACFTSLGRHAKLRIFNMIVFRVNVSCVRHLDTPESVATLCIQITSITLAKKEIIQSKTFFFSLPPFSELDNFPSKL